MESFVYTALSTDPTITSLVDTIIPMPPNAEQKVPYIGYSRAGTEPQTSLSGPVGITRYTAQIEYWSLTADERNAIGSAISDVLNGHRAGNVLGSFLVESQDSESERGFHGIQLYSIILRS